MKRRHVPSSMRCRRRWIYYVALPMILGLGSLAAIAFWVLDTSKAPTVAAIDFDVDASGDFAEAAQRIVLANLERRPGAVPPLLPSSHSELNVAVDGCDSSAKATLSVFPDPRWWLALRAGREGSSQPLAIQRGTNMPATISPGSVGGYAAAAIPGDISDIAVSIPRGEDSIPIRPTSELFVGEPGEFTVVKFKIPDRALKKVILMSEIGQTIVLSFNAPWVHSRGFLSCFVSIPALIEGQASSISGLDRAGLAIQSATSIAGRGPIRGTTTLDVSNGTVSDTESAPPPSDSAIRPTWTCHRPEKASEEVPPDCHASAVIEEPQRETWQQVSLIILGALGSAGFVGFFDGVRRILVPFD